MKRHLFASIVLSFSLHAVAAPASQASVEELLAVTEAESVMETMWGSIDETMHVDLKQATANQRFPAEQQRFLDAYPSKAMAVIRQEMNWTTMKPAFVALYQDHLNQEEVDAMVAFYKSPVGRNVIRKQPQLMQASMRMAQSRFSTFIPKIQKAVQDALREAKTR